MPLPTKLLLLAGLALALVLMLPALLVALFGRTFLYHPTRLGARALAELATRPGWQADELALDRGLRSVGLVRPATAHGTRWLLYFGGNAMDLGQIQEVLEFLRQERAWGLAAFAYRGYDGADGQPTEAALRADARRAFARLCDHYGVRPAQIVVCGESLGTGVAAALVADLKGEGIAVAGLVLVSAFRSVAALAGEKVPLVPVSFAMRDRYRTEARLATIPGPVLLVHGTDDELIPVAHGRALAKTLASRGRLVEVPERGHNDLWLGTTASNAVQEFIDGLPPPPAIVPTTP